MWAKVEHLFRVINRQLGHAKVSFRRLGVQKTAQLVTLLSLSNLWMMRKRLLISGEVSLYARNPPLQTPFRAGN